MIQGRFQTQKQFALAATTLIIASTAFAYEAPRTEARPKPILADVQLIQAVGATVLATEPTTGVGYARLSTTQQLDLQKLAHERGSCAGFEELQDADIADNNLVLNNVFGQLAKQEIKNRRFNTSVSPAVQPKANISAAVAEVSEANIRSHVEFLSAFESRDNTGSTANEPIEAFKKRIEGVLADVKIPYTIDLISHRSTRQKSIRVSLAGSERPSEIVAIGGHVDSINQEWFGDRKAPGADDNASGSACVLETLRIVSHGPQPQRTVEFFWYAGEESGLLGSAEIARDYKAQNKDVVGVVQLDMTSFAGAGSNTIASMSDFTSAWMRSYFVGINDAYVKAKILDDRCGYGCSDHASWYKQGYPTLMPAEAPMSTMNHKLHTAKDLIDSQTSFSHAALFAKAAVGIALDLGNSTDRQP